jgi:hypothetical protein
MMLYLVGIVHRDGGTEGDKEISSRLWMCSAKLVIIFVFRYEIFARGNKEVLTFYDHSFLPFLFFKIVVVNLLTLEHDSAIHDVVSVVHGIFLLEF